MCMTSVSTRSAFMMAVAYSLSLLLVVFVALQWRPVISQPRLPYSSDPQCFNGSRVQCGTPKTTSAASCSAAGCCWDTPDEPSCFFPIPVYIVQSVSKSIYGVKMTLKNQFDKGGPRQIATPISPLQLEMTMQTSTRLHVKITDPNNKRYEVPEDILPVPPHPTIPMKVYEYGFEYAGEGEQFYMVITRKNPYQVLFNTSSMGFIYSDNLLMIGTNLPKNYNIYGFGEHKTPLKLKPGSSYTLWSYDIPTPEHVNLYGSHPFYMELRDGYAHGVFLRNSNGIDVMLDQTSLTYRVIGGVLDFYFFVGDNGLPDEIINGYHEVIGRPAMPPYWALGYHQCRWGYKKLQDVKDILSNFTDAKIPLDTLWMDIDYMDSYKDFTTDPENFPSSDLKEFIGDVHKSGKHFVVIVDPAISNQAEDYKPYEDGVSMDVFIKDSKGKDFVGKVWPGLTVFPDFLNPTTGKYWEKQIATFLYEVPVDGLWIDMNEPSNFCNGSCSSVDFQELRSSNQTSFGILNPPYNLNNQDAHFPLHDNTLDMDCKQYGGHSFYDTHNLYGFTEAIATRKALLSVNPDKRPFVLSRSTFPGSGVHTAHWLGDNFATSEDMYYSIPGMLNFQMFGIPLVGADICGFKEDTTEELCGRWMSLGAFYPFMRNHNINTGRPQEPYRWSSVAAISQKFLSIRYSLLPYLYTLFYRTTVGSSKDRAALAPSSMVAMPLFMEFPKDSNCLSIDDQFLLGSALLISPQLKLGEEGKKLLLYLPPAKWYDWYTYEAVTDRGELSISVDTPMDHLPIYIRGGYIILMQDPALTTTESRNNPYSLLVALPGTDNNTAYGDLYLDDGESYNPKEYTYMMFSYKEKHLFGGAYGSDYASKHLLPLLTKVTIIGITGQPKSVTVNSNPAKFSYTTVGETTITEVLTVRLENIPIGTNFDLDWS